MSATRPSATRPPMSQSGSVRGVSIRAGGARPALRAAASVLRRPLNPLIRRLAGSRRLRSFAVIHHRGRRSGRAYETPVSARPSADGFVIPLTFGEASDWFQNVRAAGGCVIRWNGVDYAVVDPTVVDLATARPAFGRLERALLPLMGIRWFALVRCADATGHDSAPDPHADPHADPHSA